MQHTHKKPRFTQRNRCRPVLSQSRLSLQYFRISKVFVLSALDLVENRIRILLFQENKQLTSLRQNPNANQFHIIICGIYA